MTKLKDATLVSPPNDGVAWLPYQKIDGRWCTVSEKFGRCYVGEQEVEMMIETRGFYIDG